MLKMIVCMSFMSSESRSGMSPAPKDGAKMLKETRHGLFMSSLGRWRLLPEDVGRRVEEPRREVHVIVAQLAVLDRDDELRLVHFLLEVDKQQLVDGGRESAVVMDCLLAFAFSRAGLGDVLDLGGS